MPCHSVPYVSFSFINRSATGHADTADDQNHGQHLAERRARLRVGHLINPPTHSPNVLNHSATHPGYRFF